MNEQQNSIAKYLTIGIVVLAALAIALNLVIFMVGRGAASAESSVSEIQQQAEEAQAQNAQLQQQASDQLLEWRNAQGRLSFLGDGSGKVAYLTFDDGPCDSVTKKNLKTLEEKGAVATWFCLGNDEEYDYLNLELCKTIEDAGHAVGIHDWDQNDSYDYYKSSVNHYFKSDFDKVKKKIEAAVGHEINIMRFAGGSPTIGYYNSEIAKKLPREMITRGYQYFDWNVLAGDSEPQYMVNGSVPKDVLVSNVLDNAKTFAKSNSPICVLMHDNPGKESTAEALPEIIDGLKDLGYEFKTLSWDSPGFYQLVIT